MDSGKAWVYILILLILFGMLYLMKFIFPHYEPEEDAAEITYPEEQAIKEEFIQSDNKITDVIIEQTAAPKTGSADKNTTKSQNQSSTGNDEYFVRLINEYRNNQLSKLEPGHPRTDVVIRYYKHPPDGNRVYALRDLGFYIHERPVEQTMANYESNAIYYGDNVRKEDLLIVAYTLLKQGMPIKNIGPSAYHDDWKSNAIEIGADSTALDKNPLTPGQLKDLQFDFL